MFHKIGIEGKKENNSSKEKNYKQTMHNYNHQISIKDEEYI